MDLNQGFNRAIETIRPMAYCPYIYWGENDANGILGTGLSGYFLDLGRREMQVDRKGQGGLEQFQEAAQISAIEGVGEDG